MTERADELMATSAHDTESRPATAGALHHPGSPLNLPNLITLSRLVLAVFVFWLIDRGRNWTLSCVVFLVAAATDALDGYIARRYGLITKLGGAFVFLMKHPYSGIDAWMTIAVLGREMFVTSLRSMLEQEGRDFSAVWSGKIKMILQCAAVAASLMYLEFGRGSAWENELWIALETLLWTTVAVTLYSGWIYIARAIAMFRKPA
jgi:CDP-diacylglycerol---glycerol-3-phosphate 3-phosphatidyltransferase